MNNLTKKLSCFFSFLCLRLDSDLCLLDSDLCLLDSDLCLLDSDLCLLDSDLGLRDSDLVFLVFFDFFSDDELQSKQ